eukprot:TRINITY_DN1354_c0_g2_i1.p1 TRINITY_DN1354_c0_g2~~TRINITY_DN1354_c0_g2_i1.p1  ORF type:complete len:615 (-),score=76.33 TRINITY_DN1354_c0_g2_i1:170-2014(-)
MAKLSTLQQLENLIQCLHGLGKELPGCLFSLTQVVQPQLPSELRVPLLGQIFSEVPQLLQKNAHQIVQLVAEPPEHEIAFRLLLDLRQVQRLLTSISYLQLLHLTNNMIPPGSPQQQLAFLSKIQEIFQSWSMETVIDYHATLLDTPLHLERQKFLQLEPQIAIEALHLVIELLKLPVEELRPFREWIGGLCQNQLILLVNLLQMEPAVLIEIKRRIMVEVLERSNSGTLQASPGDKRDRFGNPKTQRPADYNNVASISESIRRRSNLPVSDGIHEPVNKKLNHSQLKLMENAVVNNNYRVYQPTTLELDAPPLEIGTDLFLGETVIVSPSNVSGSSSLFVASHSGLTVNASAETALPTSPVLSASRTPETHVPLTSLSFSHGQLDLSNFDSPEFQLRIVKQPPAKTVYQRILKPFPSIMLLGPGANENNNNLFVEASLLRSDSDIDLPLCLDGNRIIRISGGVFATFKKLKILSTSQQQGTLFRLKFQLKKYVGNVFEILPAVFVTSNPIEVFSHTHYLSERKNSPPPPNVTEILPNHGSSTGNTRVAILGSNFFSSPNLRVRFGDSVVTATFHESGTLICTTPPCNGEKVVKVRVSNDGKDFCQTFATFSYT